jgi:hypothetical protein
LAFVWISQVLCLPGLDITTSKNLGASRLNRVPVPSLVVASGQTVNCAVKEADSRGMKGVMVGQFVCAAALTEFVVQRRALLANLAPADALYSSLGPTWQRLKHSIGQSKNAFYNVKTNILSQTGPTGEGDTSARNHQSIANFGGHLRTTS